MTKVSGPLGGDFLDSHCKFVLRLNKNQVSIFPVT